jgi:hypothetical protein
MEDEIKRLEEAVRKLRRERFVLTVSAILSLLLLILNK